MALLWQKGKKETDVKADLPAQSGKAVIKAPVKEKKEKKPESQAEKRAAAAAGVVFPKGSAVIRPRVTEKAGVLSEKRIYTFDVRTDANTRQIAAAIKEAYKVVPVRVNIAPVKAKSMFVRGRKGMTNSGKKAYVFLKEGDKIEFI